MKPIFREKTNAEVGKPALLGFIAACCLGVAMGANADVDEGEPYFQLFPGAPYDFATGDSPGDAIGNPSSVTICGSSDCSAEITVEWIATDDQPAGTGYRQSFLRLKQPEGNGPKAPQDGTSEFTETGYNTDFAGGLQNDTEFTNDSQDFTGPQGNDWNRAVLISDLQEQDGYYYILLDLNETGANEYIMLDEFEIHVSDASNGEVSDYDPNYGGDSEGFFDTVGNGGSSEIVFDMDWWDNGGLVLKSCDGIPTDEDPDTPVKGGNCGSGDEDYVFKIPTELLADHEYLHIVAALGLGTYDEDGWNPQAYAEAGFDEFASYYCDDASTKKVVESCETPNPPGEIPIPGTAFLIGVGLLGFCRTRRSKSV